MRIKRILSSSLGLWRKKDSLHLRSLLRKPCSWGKSDVTENRQVEGSFREEGSASQGHKGSVVGGWPMGGRGYTTADRVCGWGKRPSDWGPHWQRAWCNESWSSLRTAISRVLFGVLQVPSQSPQDIDVQSTDVQRELQLWDRETMLDTQTQELEAHRWDVWDHPRIRTLWEDQRT